MLALVLPSLVGGIVILVKTRTVVVIDGQVSSKLPLPGGRSLYVNAHGLAF